MARFLPFAVWMVVVTTASLVGASLGSAGPRSVRNGLGSAACWFGLAVALAGYSLLTYSLLFYVDASRYAPTLLRTTAFYVALSLSGVALLGATFRKGRALLGGALIGVATTACAVGSGLPLILWYVYIFPGPAVLATFVPTFAGAWAAHREVVDTRLTPRSPGPRSPRSRAPLESHGPAGPGT
jgi:hypothetical protein